MLSAAITNAVPAIPFWLFNVILTNISLISFSFHDSFIHSCIFSQIHSFHFYRLCTFLAFLYHSHFSTRSHFLILTTPISLPLFILHSRCYSLISFLHLGSLFLECISAGAFTASHQNIDFLSRHLIHSIHSFHSFCSFICFISVLTSTSFIHSFPNHSWFISFCLPFILMFDAPVHSHLHSGYKSTILPFYLPAPPAWSSGFMPTCTVWSGVLGPVLHCTLPLGPGVPGYLLPVLGASTCLGACLDFLGFCLLPLPAFSADFFFFTSFIHSSIHSDLILPF